MPALRRPSPRRLALGALAVVALLAAAVAADAVVLVARIPVAQVRTAGSENGRTYLILGSDSRQRVPDTTPGHYADASQATGERADLVLLVRHPAEGPAEVVSIPRDLFVDAGTGPPYRLGLALQEGPTTMVDALCRDLGIGVDHLVIVDFAGLVAVVDAIGGVEVATPSPVRDRRAALFIPSAGTHRLDGEDALAWLRSRHPETHVDGRWVPASGVDRTRSSHALEVTGQLVKALSNPLKVQRAAWSGGPHLRRDSGTGLIDLVRLGRDLRAAYGGARVRAVPTRLTQTQVPFAFPTAATEAALEPLRTRSCTDT